MLTFVSPGTGGLQVAASAEQGALWMESPVTVTDGPMARLSFSAALESVSVSELMAAKGSATLRAAIATTGFAQLQHGSVVDSSFAAGVSSADTISPEQLRRAASMRGSATLLLSRTRHSLGGALRPGLNQPLTMCFDRQVQIGTSAVTVAVRKVSGPGGVVDESTTGVVFSASVSASSGVSAATDAPHVVLSENDRCANLLLPAAALPNAWTEYAVVVPRGLLMLKGGQPSARWNGATFRVVTSVPELLPTVTAASPTNGSMADAVSPGNASLELTLSTGVRLPGAGVARWPSVSLVQAGAVQVQGTGFASDSLEVR